MFILYIRAFNILTVVILNSLSIWHHLNHIGVWSWWSLCLWGMYFFVCLTNVCFWKPDVLSRTVVTEVNGFLPGIWHAFPSGRLLLWGFELIYLGVGQGLRFVIAMVTIGTLQVSNSSSNTLCLRSRLVGPRFFPLSIFTFTFQSSFCTALREDLLLYSHSFPLPEVFSCYLLLYTC